MRGFSDALDRFSMLCGLNYNSIMIQYSSDVKAYRHSFFFSCDGNVIKITELLEVEYISNIFCFRFLFLFTKDLLPRSSLH